MKDSCIIYCSVTHLFVSCGLYYAAELAERYEVHVVLHRDQARAISDDEQAALVRRGVVFHWLDPMRLIAKNKYFSGTAVRFLDEIQPGFILSLDDMGLFACYLGRQAERREIPFVCFHGGAFLAASGAEQRRLELEYGYATQMQALRDRGRSSLTAHVIVRLSPLLRHALDYWVGPTIVEGRPFRGTSSLYLRIGFECQRYGCAYLVNQPGGRDFRIADGMPEDMIVSVPHPLSGAAGQAIYQDMYGAGQSEDILVLVSYSMQPGPDHVAVAAASLSRLISYLAGRYDTRRIFVKLHPAMAGDEKGAVLQCLQSHAETYSNVNVVSPSVNAVGLLGQAAVVISTPSTVLGLSRLFDSKIVVCTSFDTPQEYHPLPDPTGVHLFRTASDLEGVDLFGLDPVPAGAEIPSDAAREPIDQIIHSRFSERASHRTGEGLNEQFSVRKTL